MNDLDEESEMTREEVHGDIYTTILGIKLESTMIMKRKKMNKSECMKKMITTSRTKTNKMKMKMKTKFIT